MTEPFAHRLHDVWQASRSAWPGLEVAVEEFERHLRERANSTFDAAALSELNTVDLYLTCACLLRRRGALEQFERGFLVHVPRFVARLRPSATLLEELLQTLRERLFVGSADAPPRIGIYHGRGPLLAWVRVTALHAALELLRARESRRESALDEEDLAQLVSSDLEHEILLPRYRESFEAAVAAALSELPRRERNLLRLHLVHRVSILKLSAVFHVGQATIVRRMAAVRQGVRTSVFHRLGQELGLSETELESLAGLLLSKLELSLATCLRSVSE